MKQRQSTAPVSSSSLCPACGKAVDTLRAGHVAILDGTFRYFCDATCKGAYVDVTSKRPSLDVALTADPPPVQPVASTVTSSLVRDKVVSGVQSATTTTSEPAEPFFPAPSEDADASDPVEASAAEDDEHRDVVESAAVSKGGDDITHEELREEQASGEETPEPEEEAPSTLRSPASVTDLDAVASADAREEEAAPRDEAATKLVAKQLLERLVVIAPIAGVIAGVLSAVVSLAGEPAGVVRLPLALAAAAVVFARVAVGRREQSAEPALWLVVLPIALGSVLAAAAIIVHDPHADACASFVGLAAASALTVEILFARARRDVVAARARTVSALAVKARLAPAHDGVAAREVEAAQVKPGEQVIVEAGETIPVDGIITSGEAQVAPWLDSPSLLEKTEGDAVVAGAVVMTGRLRVNATFSGAERAWLRLAPTSPSAPDSGEPSEASERPRYAVDVAAPLVALFRRIVERGAPAAALVVAGVVYADNGSWIDVALAGCAGAFALAASAAVSSAALAHARGHAAAQRRGIVYKDPDAFDTAARADVAVVCSRGTILLGEPEIALVEAISSSKETEGDTQRVLAIAAGAEMSSTHPFASAILREARARGIRPDNVRSALGHSGLGVTALAANGDRVIVGSRSFLLQEKVSVAIADARTSELEAQGRSVLLVAVGGRLVGLLALQDGLRPGARAAVQRMHDARIEPVLLSGEARDTCETIARALDIEHVRPEILPIDRGAEVRALADGGRVVAALGHASTDDGALGAADVSVAMEAAGSAPGEWGVALASDDVRDAALALTLPRAARDRAKTAVIVGGLAQAASALGIALGLVPPAVIPVVGVLTAAITVSLVRDPAPSF